MSQLMLDREFTEGLAARWPAVRALLNDMIKEGGLLDQYYEEMKTAQHYDNELWGYYDPSGSIIDDPGRSYSAEIEQLRAWIQARRDWVDSNLNMLKDPACSISFMVDGQETPFAQIKLLKGCGLNSIHPC